MLLRSRAFLDATSLLRGHDHIMAAGLRNKSGDTWKGAVLGAVWCGGLGLVLLLLYIGYPVKMLGYDLLFAPGFRRPAAPSRNFQPNLTATS